MAGSTTSASAAVSVMNCSSTTVNRSGRRSPSSTRSWSGAIAAGLEFQHTSAFTGGSSAGSVRACPSWDMLIVRTGPGSRSGRRSGAALTAAAVASGMYEQPPPRSRQAPVRQGSEAIVAYACGAPAWRCAPTPSRSSAGRVVANSRPTRAMSSAGTPHSSEARSGDQSASSASSSS